MLFYKLQIKGQVFPLEIVLLKKASHLNGVIKLIDYYERPDSYILIMERPGSYRDLFDYITEKGALSEKEARDFFRQIVQTVIELHAAGVVHRDIKDENILVDLDSMRLRLIDFGSGAIMRDTPYTEFEGVYLLTVLEWLWFDCIAG